MIFQLCIQRRGHEASIGLACSGPQWAVVSKKKEISLYGDAGLFQVGAVPGSIHVIHFNLRPCEKRKY